MIKKETTKHIKIIFITPGIKVEQKCALKMHNLPPKFNQICRLCLTLVEPKGDGDEIIKKLSIFNAHGQSSKKSNERKSSDKMIRDDDQLSKKAKRSNEISISLSGGNGINNGFNDDSDGDLTQRILQCLSIKVGKL